MYMIVSISGTFISPSIFGAFILGAFISTSGILISPSILGAFISIFGISIFGLFISIFGGIFILISTLGTLISPSISVLPISRFGIFKSTSAFGKSISPLSIFPLIFGAFISTFGKFISPSIFGTFISIFGIFISGLLMFNPWIFISYFLFIFLSFLTPTVTSGIFNISKMSLCCQYGFGT